MDRLWKHSLSWRAPLVAIGQLLDDGMPVCRPWLLMQQGLVTLPNTLLALTINDHKLAGMGKDGFHALMAHQVTCQGFGKLVA